MHTIVSLHRCIGSWWEHGAYGDLIIYLAGSYVDVPHAVPNCERLCSETYRSSWKCVINVGLWNKSAWLNFSEASSSLNIFYVYVGWIVRRSLCYCLSMRKVGLFLVKLLQHRKCGGSPQNWRCLIAFEESLNLIWTWPCPEHTHAPNINPFHLKIWYVTFLHLNV